MGVGDGGRWVRLKIAICIYVSLYAVAKQQENEVFTVNIK